MHRYTLQIVPITSRLRFILLMSGRREGRGEGRAYTQDVLSHVHANGNEFRLGMVQAQK